MCINSQSRNMAFFNNILGVVAKPIMAFIQRVPTQPNILTIQPFSPILTAERSKYTDWRMLRDVKRRKVIKEYGKLRVQINALRHNTILPPKIKEIADKEIAALPTDSCHTKLHWRCVLTSRARGRYKKFRMSRIIWRHFADYNQISGAERAMW